MIDVNDQLIMEMEKAEQALTVHADGFINKEILNACIAMVEKGMALELFLDMENETFLDGNPFLRGKCQELSDKGGSIFLFTNNAPVRFWQCLLDFREYVFFSVEGGMVERRTEIDLPDFPQAIRLFETKKAEAKPYLTTNDDIQIRVFLSDRLIMMGDAVELVWEVERAEKVVVQGLGKVEPYGRKRIRLEKDSIIKVGATNNKQSRIKAFPVKVSGELKIDYDLGFLSVGTGEFHSLVNSDIHPHVYGISRGNQVKISWQVPLAREVKVMPFNVTGNTGEYVFTPNDSLQIEIQGLINNKLFTRKIQVLMFPIAVFKQKLVSIEVLKEKKYEFTIPTILGKGLGKIKDEQQKTYLELNQKIMKEYDKTNLDKLNLSSIHKYLFGFLKKKYEHREGIIKEIKSIESYYEQSPTDTGTSTEGI